MQAASIERVGVGTDIHRLEVGRILKLGGIEIEFDRGLKGHSDGDVVLHATADALLGAAGLPDIGEQFPDDDPRYKDADSRTLVSSVVALVAELGFEPSNVDVVIHAERPKLTAYKTAMRQSLAGLLALPPERVNIKAKTHEGLDAVGRGEAIACTAVVGLGRPANTS